MYSVPDYIDKYWDFANSVEIANISTNKDE